MSSAATAGLALAALGLPAAAGAMSPAAAANAAPAITSAVRPAAAATNTSAPIISQIETFAGDEILDHGTGKDSTMSILDNSWFDVTGKTGKWIELSDHAGSGCLDLVGSVSAGFKVNEESCNGRSAELWWLPSGYFAQTQIQNQYGTTLYGHDACLWNDSTSSPDGDVEVRKCVAGSAPPAAEYWQFPWPNP